ncbi:MAG: HupE/UreJ family protein [Hyphomicrobiales bacterium]|nr:HupE/UreJ family protein [Hyphomicrobiales bacterium]
MTSRSWSSVGVSLRRVLAVAWLVVLPVVAGCGTSAAHEVRPSYLELTEVRADEFDILFKTPMRGDLRLALAPAFSGKTEPLAPTEARATGDASVQTWRIRTVDRLRGQKIGIIGLENTMTDALVRVAFLDGSTWVRRLTPQEPVATVPERQSFWSVAGLYLKLGIEHILLGIDHLLFVLALLIIAREAWLLIKTVTAFTVAHSITLALATLGYVHVPSAPVEAVIALSIVFVAREIIRVQQGEVGLTARLPWLVAFTFGLLHGLGFAGALSEVGLPEGHVPLALLFFNIGVEIGQLLFIAAVLGSMAILKRIRIAWPDWARSVPAYAIGSVAMFWVIARVSSF